MLRVHINHCQLNGNIPWLQSLKNEINLVSRVGIPGSWINKANLYCFVNLLLATQQSDTSIRNLCLLSCDWSADSPNEKAVVGHNIRAATRTVNVGDGSEVWNQANLVIQIEAEVPLFMVTCSLIHLVHWSEMEVIPLTRTVLELSNMGLDNQSGTKVYGM